MPIYDYGPSDRVPTRKGAWAQRAPWRLRFHGPNYPRLQIRLQSPRHGFVHEPIFVFRAIEAPVADIFRTRIFLGSDIANKSGVRCFSCIATMLGESFDCRSNFDCIASEMIRSRLGIRVLTLAARNWRVRVRRRSVISHRANFIVPGQKTNFWLTQRARRATCR